MPFPTIPTNLVCVDVETRDPELKGLGPGWAFPQRGGYITGYALGWREGEEIKSVYLPVRHEGGGNLPLDAVTGYLGPLFADPRREWVMANALYDYGWIRASGFELTGRIHDVQIQAPLLDDQRLSNAVDRLGQDYLGERKDETSLREAAKEFGIKDPKADMWMLPGPLVEPYARQDAELELKLYEHMAPQIKEKELTAVYDLECALLPVLYEMRRRGVKVDTGRADAEREKLLNVEREIQEALYSLTGELLDPWVSESIVRVFRAEGIEDFPLTPKEKKPSITNGFLASLAEPEDTRVAKIAKGVADLRRYQKARSTFLEGMILGHAINGRIHSQLHALRSDEGGSVSGRFSSSTPNLQQVPARDYEIGPMVRGLFLPDDGKWAALDYSSQEPRLAVHFAALARIRGGPEMAERFKANPRADLHQEVADLMGVDRKTAKIINLGLMYGMGGGKLCAELGLPTEKGEWKGREVLYAGEEGKELLEKYHETVPFVKGLSDTAKRLGAQRGYVRTVLGRRATFPRQKNGEVWFTHKALNRVIQGSAADMTKKAMVDIWQQKGKAPLLSIHDELDFDVADEAEARELADMMERAIPLEVPVLVDVEIGETWAESMEK